MIVGTKELAGALGVSRQRVNELARKGKIAREPDGKWDLAKVQVALGRNLDTHQVAPSLGEEPKSPASAGRGSRKAKISQPNSSSTDGISLADAQLKHELAKASKTEYEVAKLRGILIDAEQAVLEWQKVIVAARERALQLPGKLAPKVAVESDVLVCQHLIDREMRSFLTELSEYRPNAA